VNGRHSRGLLDGLPYCLQHGRQCPAEEDQDDNRDERRQGEDESVLDDALAALSGHAPGSVWLIGRNVDAELNFAPAGDELYADPHGGRPLLDLPPGRRRQ
jgi:hypothetical protein